MNIEVLFSPEEKNPFAVIYKPKGLPSAPLFEGDESALTQAVKIFPRIKSVCGKKQIEAGLLHRLDTATDGLMLIAASQDFYDLMLTEQDEGRFIKTYSACCTKSQCNKQGFPPLLPEYKSFSPPFCVQVSSCFRFYGPKSKEVRPVLLDSSGRDKKKSSGKIYTTEISVSDKNDNGTYSASCRIQKGFRHQVRCHLAWLGYPVIGDELYGSDDFKGELLFTAQKIQFTNPLTHEDFTFSL